MKNWKLTLEYDGTKFSGWQEQPNARTIQGVLRRAAEEFLGVAVEIQGAGRTDSGVHALAQVAHIRTRSTPKCHAEEFRRELNDRLPADVSVMVLEEATPKFHARHDAIGRVYQYQISTRKTAFAKRQVWWVKPRLDVEAMATAAESLVGRHDFVQFRQLDPLRPDESTIVELESAALAIDGHLILFRIEASHFLWKMVRRVVGMLVKVGLREITPEDFAALVENKPRRKIEVAACTAPASGLFLAEVKYR